MRASQGRARGFEAWAALRNRPVSFAVLAATRLGGDVVHLPGIGHVVNDAETARAILLDPARFNSHDPGSFGHMITSLLGPRALINMDGQAHQDLKRDLLAVFSQTYVRAVIEHATGGLVDRLRASLLAGQTVDFARFMQHYAGAMACAMVGVRLPVGGEEAAWEEIFVLATDIMSLAGLQRRALSAAARARAQVLTARLAAHISAGYADGDAGGLSVTQRLRAQGLAFEEVRSLVSVVLVGATELITYGLPRMAAVMIDSGAMVALADNPALLDRAVDEAYRVVTPSNAVLRAVAVDCDVAGHRFRRGDRVVVAFCNIMRQSRHFPDPGRFDIERVIAPAWRRLPFGAGPHTCLGVGMALAETRHVLGLLAELGGRFVIERRGFNRGKIYAGYTRLLIRQA